MCTGSGERGASRQKDDAREQQRQGAHQALIVECVGKRQEDGKQDGGAPRRRRNDERRRADDQGQQIDER